MSLRYLYPNFRQTGIMRLGVCDMDDICLCLYTTGSAGSDSATQGINFT